MTVSSSPTPFTRPVMAEIFPQDRTDRFFEALLGDAGEGAYDIDLVYVGESAEQIQFEFHLRQRPGRCLACNLTYGLPEVFIRHPVIDMAGLIRQIDSRICNGKRCGTWRLGRTREVSRTLHVLPLSIGLVPDHQGSNWQR
ncbi:MAG: pancreas/duodenum homeobox protein 1 [Desulfosarcina sp.]